MSDPTDASNRRVTLRPRTTATHQMSRTQQLIWTSQRRYDTTPLANMADRIRITGTLDPTRFVAAFDAVVRHVDLLRTVVAEGTAEARILAHPPTSTGVIDLDPADLDTWSAARIANPVDATTGVYDSVLLRHSDDDWTWWIDVHHIAIDAWSAALLVEATAHAYAHDGLPEEADLDEIVGVGFFEHVTSSRETDPDLVAERAAAWAADEKTADSKGPLTPYGGRGPRTTTVERLPVPMDDWSDELHASLSEEYRSLSRELSVLTLSAMAMAITVHRLDGRSNVVVGVPVHHRSGKRAGRVVGPLMELYPLTVTFDATETHREMFVRTLRSIMSLLRRARPGESPDTAFEIVVNVTTARYRNFAGLPAAREWIRSGHVEPNHSIRVQVFDRFEPDAATDGAHTLDWELDLNVGLSTDGTHRSLPSHFAAVLRGIVLGPHDLAGRSPIVNDHDRRELAELNPDAAPRRHETPLHESIRAALRSDSAWIVVEQDGVTMRADEFDREADRVAAWLVASGLAPGTAVGIRMDRGIEVLVAVHAVLRAGGRFVFLDPADPSARHDAIFADAGLFTILDDLPDRDADTGEGNAALPSVDIDDGAYILYTSGSTGVPKGVPISHRGLADYLAFAVDSYTDESPPWVALHSSLVFDLTVTSLFLSFLTGGRTVVFADEPVEALGRISADPRLTFLKATPSQLEILTRLTDSPMRLDTVVVGGEAFRRPVAERLRDACADGVRIFNEYGPTEAVVGCMIHEYDPELDIGADIPIGHAAPGTQIAILDPLGQVSPIGAWGELYVRRPGMATGYLNRPELTAERFLDLPIDGDDRAILGQPGDDHAGPWYRTGDRVRVERPGVTVFGGRHDDQVKVNGIRLEPAEVEAAMVAHPSIDTALARVWSPAGAAARNRATLQRCVRCGLGTDVPDLEIDADGLCSLCRQFDEVEPQTRQWFKSETDLDARLNAARDRASGVVDCIHLLSGGKDSTYALYQLVERGWRVHAFTLDNGFISEGAKDNIRRTVADLGISHEFATTPAMNEIFNDSLDRHSNVCQGCYKTIYTLAVARADQMGVPVIVTGLSRGQFFETRLVPHQFEHDRFDPDAIDRTVLEARRVYHQSQDAVTRLLPEQEVFDDTGIFERVEFVDFYRYVDVELAEMYDFLESRAPWVRPTDTGRSTNCLINVAGIHVHQSERGFHNYAEPYSWDVRLGHKTRDEALEELDDEIDRDEVDGLLEEIGYEPKIQGVLTAWYQSSSGTDLDPDDLRRFLRDRLPEHAVPAAFVRVDDMPLAASAKADPAALPAPTRFHRRGAARTSPTTPTEQRLVQIWSSILSLESVGTTDDFFDLGGASLDALEVVAIIDQEFATDLPDAAVFRSRTIRELADLVDAATGTSTNQIIEPLDPDEPLPLSAGQEAMLFEYRTDPTDTRYNVTRLYTLTGPVDIDRLVGAIRDVVAHHEPLHTCYDADRKVLSVDDALLVVDHDRLSADAVEELADEQRRIPFDLDRGPLVRVHVARTADDECRVLIGKHHIVTDAVAFDTFWDQVAERAAGAQLPDLPVTYAQHARFQAAALEADPTSRQFWLERARHREKTAGLRLPAPLPAVPDGYLERPADFTTRELYELPDTPFATSLAAVGAVVSLFGGGSAVEVAVTASTKDRSDLGPVVGYHLNTLAAVLAPEPDQEFRSAVAAASSEVADILPHRTLPFATVVRDARKAGLPVPDVSVMLAYQRLESPTYPGASVGQRILASGTSVSDVTLFVQERDDTVQLGIEYRGSVIGPADAKRLLDAFHLVLSSGVRAPTRRISELVADLRSEDLVGPSPAAPARNVLSRLADMIDRRPDATAVEDGHGSRLSYDELAVAVVGVAERIEDVLGDSTDRRIGVSVARSTDLVVALLAVQSAGAAYVALDPTLPTVRTDLVARTAGIDLLLTDDPTRRSGLEPSRVLSVTGPGSSIEANGDAASDLRARIERLDDEAAAYVIFTSGSTGLPRGVAVSHANLAASTAARDDWFDAVPSRFLMTSSSGFDSSVAGLFWPLATGGTVVLPSDEVVRDIDRLAAVIEEQSITHTLMVPSLARTLLDRAPHHLRGLEISIVAGEACPRSLVELHAELLPSVALVNEYGPTETTVWATAHRITPDDDPVPIGGPIPGTTVRLADESLRPVPDGVAGELLISGPGVTAGYVDDADATAARFVTADDRRWYRTGDLAREVNGTLVFLGRTDDQLNVGGVRVEPAEVERELDSMNGVAASVVVAAGTPPVLVAHVVLDGAGPLDEADLRSRLGERLPPAVVPRRFFDQPSLPRTPHGKLDRAAARSLPMPPAEPVTPNGPEVTGLVGAVLSAWRTALAPSRIEMNTDFFAAGGDSLTAVELVTDLGERLGRTVPVAALLSGRTPDGMLARLAPLADQTPAIQPVHFRPGTPGGPLVVMTPSWDDVFGYQSLAMSLPDDVEVIALDYEPGPGRTPINRVPELVDEMLHSYAELDTVGRTVVVLGWSIGGVSAMEMAARLSGAGTPVAAAVLVDSFHPGEETHLWSNRWWNYKSMMRRGAGPELRREVGKFLRRRSPRRLAERIGRRLIAWSESGEPSRPKPNPAAGSRVPGQPQMQGSFPVEAFGHRPSAPGVPVIFYRATATNPARTIDRWREVAPELVDVAIEGRHRGFASIMHAPRVEEIAADLADRISGRRPLQPASD